jgi:hypothetical protein
MTVAGVSFVAYIIAGLVPKAMIALPIAVLLMIGTLIFLRKVMKADAAEYAK